MLFQPSVFEEGYVKDHVDTIKSLLESQGFQLHEDHSGLHYNRIELEDSDEVYIRDNEGSVVFDSKGRIFLFFNENHAYYIFQKKDKLPEFLGFFSNLYLV